MFALPSKAGADQEPKVVLDPSYVSPVAVMRSSFFPSFEPFKFLNAGDSLMAIASGRIDPLVLTGRSRRARFSKRIAASAPARHGANEEEDARSHAARY